MSESSNIKGIICMVLACLAFICCDSFLKLMLADGTPPLQTLALRGVFASLSCAVLLTALGMLQQIGRAFGFWSVIRASFEVVAVTAFIFALQTTPIASVTAIYQIAPLIVLAGASLIWHEKVGASRWVLIALGFAGAVVVAQPNSTDASPYALLALITAAGSAGRDLLSRHIPADVPGPVITLAIVVLVMLSTAISSAVFETWTPVTGRTWLCALGAGTFVMVAHLLIFLSFRFASARAIAPFYYALTVFALIFGMGFFNEWPNDVAMFGIAMIVTCGLGVLFLEKKEVRL
jgi:drug/metabolite transporter (DMT)-like permease